MRIELACRGLDIQPILDELGANPALWDTHTGRTENPDSPHHGLQDIWVRFAPPGSGANTDHRSVWYEAAEHLPSVKDLAFRLMKVFEGVELGGILITKIPAGKMCRPHVDNGWHAKHYEKFAVQLASAPGQKFCFQTEGLETEPGDLFWFDNSYEHWVINPTEHDRITLIFCIKTDVMQGAKDHE